MKLNAVIVDDNPVEHDEIEALLKGFDFIEVIHSGFFGGKPFTKAKDYIELRKPEILIIDYDLKEGSTKTGKELFKAVYEKYKCFALFVSRVPEGSNAQSEFMNSKFVRKEIDPILNIQDLTNALNLAKSYLVDDKIIKLKYYGAEKPASKRKRDSYPEEIYTKDLVNIIGHTKQYSYVYFNNEGKFVERRGPASKGTGKIIEELMKIGNPDIIQLSKSPYTILNKAFYSKDQEGMYQLKDSYKSSKRYPII